MNIERKRAMLSWVYPGRAWAKKVENMSDKRVHVIYMQCLNSGKLKGISENVKIRRFESSSDSSGREDFSVIERKNPRNTNGGGGIGGIDLGSVPGSTDAEGTPPNRGTQEGVGRNKISNNHPYLF